MISPADAIVTHPVRYVEHLQCGVCNSALKQQSIDGDHAMVECPRCDVVFQVPLRIVQCEIVTP